jgi:hypothetical protein
MMRKNESNGNYRNGKMEKNKNREAWIFYLNGSKTDLNYRDGLKANLFSQTA